MNATRSRARWIDPAWRYLKLAMLLWGIVQATWLYFRIDKYSIFVSALFIFMLIGCWAISMQIRNEK